MNELDWRRLERRLMEAHAAADPPLPDDLWHGVAAGIAGPARPRASSLARLRPRWGRRSVGFALGVVVLAAAGVALWFLPEQRAESPAAMAVTDQPMPLPLPSAVSGAPLPSAVSGAPLPSAVSGAPLPSAVSGVPLPSAVSGAPSPSAVSGVPSPSAVSGAPSPSAVSGSPSPSPSPSPLPSAVSGGPSPLPPAVSGSPSPTAPTAVLNQVLQTRRAITFAMTSDAGRIEIEPCLGRFVNVTVLDSPHRTLSLLARDRHVEVKLDGGAVMASGIAHILVPADTHLVIATQSGPVVVRGLAGPMEIDTRSGEVRVDTAGARNPAVTVATDSGAIAWTGRCGSLCLIDTRSRTGDITLRTPDPVGRNRAVKAKSVTGTVQLEEIQCTDPPCSSSPLPWRRPAPASGH